MQMLKLQLKLFNRVCEHTLNLSGHEIADYLPLKKVCVSATTSITATIQQILVFVL